MAYIKKEFDDPNDEPIINTELTSEIDVYDNKPKSKFVDLNSVSATKQLLLEAKKKRIKNKKSSNVSSKKKRTIKPKSEIELALIRYKLAFATDTTSNEIARLNRLYKDPTDKLFNKIYSRNKNESSLGNKFERKINNRLNVLQNENINQMRALHLDRGNRFGNRSKRDAKIQTETVNRNSFLDEVDSRDMGVGEEEEKDEEDEPVETQEEEIPVEAQASPQVRAYEVGAFNVEPDEDYPPPTPSINFNYLQIQAQDVVQAQNLNEIMREQLETFNEFYYGYHGRYPDRRTTRNLNFPEDITRASQNIFNRFNQRLALLDEARLARNIEDGNVEQEIDISEEEDTGNIIPLLTVTYKSDDDVDSDMEFDISDKEEDNLQDLIQEKQEQLEAFQNEMVTIQEKLVSIEARGRKPSKKLLREEEFNIEETQKLEDEIEILLLSPTD